MACGLRDQCAGPFLWRGRHCASSPCGRIVNIGSLGQPRLATRPLLRLKSRAHLTQAMPRPLLRSERQLRGARWIDLEGNTGDAGARFALGPRCSATNADDVARPCFLRRRAAVLTGQILAWRRVGCLNGRSPGAKANSCIHSKRSASCDRVEAFIAAVGAAIAHSKATNHKQTAAAAHSIRGSRGR